MAASTRRRSTAIGLAVIGAALAMLATALVTGQPQSLVARLPALHEAPPAPDIRVLADHESQGFDAAIRRWSNDALGLAADPRRDAVQAAQSPSDALLDAFAGDATAGRYANLFLIDPNGRVIASLYPSRRVGQRVTGTVDPLARAVANSRAMRAVATSTLAVEEGRATVFVAVPAADGASLVLAAGAQQLAPLIDPPLEDPSTTIELMVSIDGHWHRLAGDVRTGYRLLRAAADAERDALLGQAATGTADVQVTAIADGTLHEWTARTVPALGAMLLLSRPHATNDFAADLVHAFTRWGIPGGLALLALAAFTTASRMMQPVRAQTPPAPVPVVRQEPTISGFESSSTEASPATGRDGLARTAQTAPQAAVSRTGPGTRMLEHGSVPARVTQASRAPPTAAADPVTTDGPAGAEPPTAARLNLVDVFAAVCAGRTGAAGEILLRRGAGVVDERLGDAATITAVLGQMVDLVGAGRPGMPIVVDVEREGSPDALVFIAGASIDGSLPAADLARIDVTRDAPEGWDAATTVAIDAAGRCAAALGGSLWCSTDGRILVLRVDLPAPMPASLTRPPFRGRRALLVADDELTASLIAEQLVRLGFDVHELDDLQAALDEANRGNRAGARPCDLIVLDDRVPDAHDLERRSKDNEDSKLPAIVLLQGRHATTAPVAVTLCLTRPVDEPVLAAALIALPSLATPPPLTSAAMAQLPRPTPLPATSPRVLDGRTGRTRAGGDLARYRARLAAFVREHRGDARQFAALLAAGRPSEARQRLRALATAADELAMPALARATGNIEDALRNGRPVPPSRLHELGTTLAETMAAAEAASTDPSSASIPVSRIADSTDRAGLWRLFDEALARGDVIALELFERLAQGHDGPAWRALRDAMLVLDYARAAEIRPRVR
jgi:CheY-like chemotaxis protein